MPSFCGFKGPVPANAGADGITRNATRESMVGDADLSEKQKSLAERAVDQSPMSVQQQRTTILLSPTWEKS